MSAKSTRTQNTSPNQPSRGRADLDRLRNASEEDIARTSPPELTDLPPDLWDDPNVLSPHNRPNSLTQGSIKGVRDGSETPFRRINPG